MKKSGAISMQTETLVGIIIAIVIIAIILFFLIPYFNNGILPWSRGLPQPVVSMTGTNSSFQIVRYVIEEGDVEYYTGTEWKGFPKDPKNDKLYFGDKIVSEKSLRKSFEDYYFNVPSSASVKAGDSYANILFFEKKGDYYNGIEARDYFIVDYRGRKYIVNSNGKIYQMNQEPRDAGVGKVESNDVDASLVINLESNSILTELVDAQTKGYLNKLNGLHLENPIAKVSEGSRLAQPVELSLYSSSDIILYSPADKPLPLKDYNLKAFVNTAQYARDKDSEWFSYKVYYKNEKTLPVDIVVRLEVSTLTGRILKGVVEIKPLYNYEYEIVQLNIALSEMKDAVIGLREKIFASPILIKYVQGEEKPENVVSNDYCVQILSLKEKKFLAVRLDQPVSADAKCESGESK